MPRLKVSEPRNSDPRLTRLLWQWLIVGLLLCAFVPTARSYNPWVGWLWYWLIATPALALIAANGARLIGAFRRALSPCAPGAIRRVRTVPRLAGRRNVMATRLPRGARAA